MCRPCRRDGLGHRRGRQPHPTATLAAIGRQRLPRFDRGDDGAGAMRPLALQQIMFARLPQPHPPAGALLFFFNAIKQGDVRSWLGDEANRALVLAGKFDILASLTKELAALSDRSHMTPSSANGSPFPYRLRATAISGSDPLCA